MGLEERSAIVTDRVEAVLVECTVPEPPVPESPRVPATPDASPTARAAEATIEQTGAGPPPRP